jgi:hypothetical protein
MAGSYKDSNEISNAPPPKKKRKGQLSKETAVENGG